MRACEPSVKHNGTEKDLMNPSELRCFYPFPIRLFLYINICSKRFSMLLFFVVSHSVQAVQNAIMSKEHMYYHYLVHVVFRWHWSHSRLRQRGDL
jgi:hypothetical protein